MLYPHTKFEPNMLVYFELIPITMPCSDVPYSYSLLSADHSCIPFEVLIS